MPEDGAVTVAMRVARSPAVVEGSEQRTCDDCGESVWVSPATQTSIEQGLYPDAIRCLTCAAEGDNA